MLNIWSLAIIAIGVGFLGSLIGIGGASILVPIMVLFGIPVKEAIACGMVAIIATSSGSAATFVRAHIANIKVGMYLEMFTILGAIAGATITTYIHPTYLYFFFAAFLLTSFLKFRESMTKDFVPATIRIEYPNGWDCTAAIMMKLKKKRSGIQGNQCNSRRFRDAGGRSGGGNAGHRRRRFQSDSP